MAVTPNDVVNQALQMSGNNQSPVTGQAPLFDSTPAGIAAARLYTPCVATVARQYEWDFARQQIVLAASGRTPPPGWSFEYLYPTNGIEIWQIVPTAIGDPNNPLPTNWVEANALIGSPASQVRVIWTNVGGAQALFNNNPGPDVWDPLFRESVARLLASEFAIALSGRPETSSSLLQSAGAFVEIAKTRDA